MNTENEMLTKKDIYILSMKWMAEYFLPQSLVVIAVCIIGGIVYIFLDGFIRGFLIMLFPVLLAAFTAIYFSLYSLPALRLIKSQEKYFDFNFYEQMKSCSISREEVQELDLVLETSISRKDWFIVRQQRGVIFALKRDYIKDFAIEAGKSTYYATGDDKYVTILTADGRKITMGLTNIGAKEFKRWVKQNT